ncbi:MAG: hypothetical protein H6712_21890 [Myxococcales bacterium]|nr:hypothetical protein [Myxococcales bacterium]MCB9716529.1 hypothetical protein [Myxococcales bacterium]
MSRTLSSEHGELVYADDGVLEYRYAPGAVVDIEFARAIIREATGLLGNDAPVPSLVEPGNVKEFTREARTFFAESSENRAVSSKVALMVESPATRIIGNVFLRVSKPRIPTKLFGDRGAARAWLLND